MVNMTWVYRGCIPLGKSKYIYMEYLLYICTRPCHPPPPLPHMGWVPYTGPIRDLPPPPLWCGGGVALSPSPPCGVVDGPIYWSHMRSSPSPPRGVVGVWHCPPPPPVVWWMGPHILVPYEIFPLPPPVVWWGCGTVPLPPLWCGGGVVWYGGYVWCVWSVWYGMFGKYGMFGMYGRYGMYGMSGWYCMDGRYGM